MDGEHIEMCLARSIPPKLREAALVELGNMREELYILRTVSKFPPKSVFSKEDIEEMTERVNDPDWDISQCEDVRVILEKLIHVYKYENTNHGETCAACGFPPSHHEPSSYIHVRTNIR